MHPKEVHWVHKCGREWIVVDYIWSWTDILTRTIRNLPWILPYIIGGLDQEK